MTPPNPVPVKIIFGCTGPLWFSDDETTAQHVLETLEQRGVTELDSARGYGPSEEKLGARGAAEKGFVISTKFSATWGNKPANRENIRRSMGKSLALLGVDHVDTYYLHAPGRTTPHEETLAAIDELYKQGRFRRFGLSNFLPSEVESMVRVAKENGFVRPTVYQGNYSPVARMTETLLFPILRKHGIAFYAYSPLAGGFLTKTRAQVEEGSTARFDRSTDLGKMYSALYHKESYLEALSRWDAISQDSGIPKAELAYRWMAHHSRLIGKQGDGLVFGATSLAQVRETICGIERGPLPEDVVRRIEGVWEMVKHEAGLDTYNIDMIEK